MEAGKTRNIAIDFVKVIATLLVLNSHMGICYGDYSALATGGGLGDALFFFVSGFTLFLGQKTNFIDWYKKRIGRIYPTIIAVALVSALIFCKQQSFIEVMSAKNYWFVQCILVCYVLMYPVIKYNLNLRIWLPISIAIFTLAYFLIFDLNGQLFYGVNNMFRWLVYFSIMLLGGAISKNSQRIKSSKYSLIWMFLSVISWYGIIYVARGTWMQLLSFIPLASFCIFTYMLGESPIIKNWFSKKILGNILFIIGNLCLESYLIQKLIFTDTLNHLFPFNIPIIMLAVLVVAYIIHMLSVIISQIFNSKPFDWESLFLHKTF